MTMKDIPGADSRRQTAIRAFLSHEAAGGIVLMTAALLAVVVANSPASSAYFDVLKTYALGLSVLHWVNDGLMAVFFLLVGLEIKRQMIDGELSTWSRRALPGIAAVGGMIVPALIYVGFNWGNGQAIIAVFYTGDLQLPMLAGAGVMLLFLTALNLNGWERLWAYLGLGLVLWYFVLQSGIHATLAGVALACAIPLRPTPGRPEAAESPLRLE